MRRLLRAEAGRVVFVTVGGWLCGGVFGYPLIGLTVALGVLLGFHLWHAQALLRWLQSPKHAELPEGTGVWKVIFDASYERYRQARKRKKRLAGILREFRASTTALPDAAVVLDSKGCISWFNQAALDLIGLSGKRDFGQRIVNLLRHPDFAAYFEGQDQEKSGVEIPAPADLDSTLWIRVIPYGKEQKLLIARDVTDLKRLEQTRRDFVANASHELRTPLTVLRGYLDMLAEDAQSASAMQQWQGPVEEMRRQATRMQQIIGDLLRLAKLESSNGLAITEPVDMPALLESCLEEAELLSAGQHRIHAEIESGLGLYGNQAELHSVVANLVSNALRYTPAGGEVGLEWSLSRGRAILTVTDSGIGIAAKDLPRLTERFYRADIARSRETGGTGLGLAITKHALERHEASLRVSSQEGRGSQFRCEFPARRVWRRHAWAAAS